MIIKKKIIIIKQLILQTNKQLMYYMIYMKVFFYYKNKNKNTNKNKGTNGSNAWVIHGNHTKSGKPLLANDPHLSS